MATLFLENGISAYELAEWKRLFESAPLDGTSYVTVGGGIVDLYSPYPMAKARILADFLNAARTGWPRTVLELESLWRKRDEFRFAYETEVKAREEQIGLMRRYAKTIERERDELRAQLDAARLCTKALFIAQPYVVRGAPLATDNHAMIETALRAASEAGLLDSHSVESMPESVEAHDPARLAPVSWRELDEQDDYDDD